MPRINAGDEQQAAFSFQQYGLNAPPPNTKYNGPDFIVVLATASKQLAGLQSAL
jgi:hypothetical protein